MKTITIIGNGNMALSIAKGLKKEYSIEVVGRDIGKIQCFERELGTYVKKKLIDDFDITDKDIILCMKPSNIEEVGTKLKGQANSIYSILAGVSILKIGRNIKSKNVVRVMPNISASIGESMTILSGYSDDKDNVSSIFSLLGDTLWVDTEDELDIATVISGSGPAYLSLVAEALIKGGVDRGLNKSDASKIVKGLFNGYSKLLQETEPEDISKAVMSPNGTTVEGYNTLTAYNVDKTFILAIENAYNRAKEF